MSSNATADTKKGPREGAEGSPSGERIGRQSDKDRQANAKVVETLATVDMSELSQVLALDVFDPVLELLRTCFKKKELGLDVLSLVRSFASSFVDKGPRKSRHAILEEETTVVALGNIEPGHLYDFVRSAPLEVRHGFRYVAPAGTSYMSKVYLTAYMESRSSNGRV